LKKLQIVQQQVQALAELQSVAGKAARRDQY
jgi:hypothetical protein